MVPDTPALSAASREFTFGKLLVRPSGVRVVKGNSDTLLIEATLTNPTDETVEFDTGSCWNTYVYPASPPSAGPVWNSGRSRPWPDGAPIVCGMAVNVSAVAADTSKQFTRRYRVPQILGDSLPPGRYFIVQDVLLGKPRSQLQRLRLAVGTVDLK